MNRQKSYRIYQRLLTASFVLLCLGRAYQHFFWSTPYFSVFWDETLAGGLVKKLGYSWNAIVSSDSYLSFIEAFNIGSGIILMLTVLMVLLKPSFSKAFVWASAVILVFFTFSKWVEYNFEALIILEYSAQLSLPIYMILTFKKPLSTKMLLKIAIALTFIAHGAYALNFMPVPGQFLDMTISIFDVSESMASKILMMAGILDFIAAIGLFIPALYRGSLVYMIIWGFLTAIARIVAHVETDHIFISLHRWLFESLVRTPHFIIPMAMMYIYKKKYKK